MEHNIFRTLLKRASYASTGTLMARMSASVAGIIIARSVGPAPFGTYAAVWALIGLSAAFTEIGMTIGLKREGARFPGALPTLLGNTLILKGMIGISAMVIGYFFCSVVTNSAEASVLYLPLALAGFSTLWAEPFFAALQVKGRQRLMALLEMGRGLLFLTGIGILASFGFGIVVFAWYQGLLYAAGLIVVCFAVVPIVSIGADFSRIRSQLTGSLVFGISWLIYSSYSQIPILFLSHFRSKEEVGYFSVGLYIVALFLLAGSAASNNAFVPSLFGLYKTNREKFRQVCESMQKLFVPLGIFIASALYICSDAIIMILQGEEYRPAVEILRILCWTVALSYGVFGAGAALTAGDRMWTKVAFLVSVTLVMAIVGPVTIKHYGALGASYLIFIFWLGLVILFTPYAYRKGLIGFSGLTKVSVPAILTVSLAIVIVQLIPDRNLLGPAIFFIGSLLVWGQSTKYKLRNLLPKPIVSKL